jgi:predicted dehydrogenase
VKILIAGLGSIGQRHARNLRALLGDSADLIAYRVRGLPHVITERMTVDSSATVEGRYGIRSYTDLDAALAERPAAAIISNPTRFHLSTAARCLHAGCHVLIEKPLSDCDDGVDELIACADRRGRVLAVGYQMRFHPVLQRLRQWLAEARIGSLLRVRAEWSEFLPDAHPYEDYRESYAARRDLGGGVILSYIHEFDYLQWLFGMPSRVSTVGGRSNLLECDVEDWAVTSMQCDHDVSTELRQSFGDRRAVRACTVIGERGELHGDLLTCSIEQRDCRGSTVDRERFDAFQRNDMFLAELTAFLSAIDGGTPAVTASEGARSLRLALAAKQSLATGCAVSLE